MSAALDTQSPFWLTYSGLALDDRAEALALLSNGDIITVNGVENADRVNNLLLARYSQFGSQLWSLDIEADYRPSIASILVDSTDNIYVVGSTHQGIYGETGYRDNDIFIAKYRPNGQRLFFRKYSSGFNEKAVAATLGVKNDLYITASAIKYNDEKTHFFDQSDLFGVLFTGNRNSFYMKISGDDGRIQRFNIAGSADSGAKGIARAEALNFTIISGETNEAVNGVSLLQKDGRPVPSDFILTRNEATASIAWIQTREAINSNIIVNDVEKSIYLVDQARGLVKLDLLNGNLLWSQELPQKNYILSLLPNGCVLVAPTKSVSNLVIQMISPSGLMKDKIEISHSGNLTLSSVLENGKGSLLLAGSLSGMFLSNELPASAQIKAPGVDAFVLITKSPFSEFKPRRNDGIASFKLSLSDSKKQALTVSQIIDDPDGNGIPKYLWQSSSNGATWIDIPSTDVYTFADHDEGRQFRVIATYVDGEGFPESFVTPILVAPIRNSGSASYALSGLPRIGNTLTVENTKTDPDGQGVESIQWQSLSNDLKWNSIGSGFSLPLFDSYEGHRIRAVVSYNDTQGFQEFIELPTIRVEFKNRGLARYIISGHSYVGNTLSAVLIAKDPDGSSSPVQYYWRSRRDKKSPWRIVGRERSYHLSLADLGCEIQLQVNYVDLKGFRESLEPLLTSPVAPAGEGMSVSSLPFSRFLVEGESFNVNVRSRINQIGSSLYWLLEGKGITKADLANKTLSGSGVIPESALIDFSLKFKTDGLREGVEYCSFSLFADAARTHLLTPSVFFTVVDAGVPDPGVSSFVQSHIRVDRHRFGDASNNIILLAPKEKSYSWALWGGSGDDQITGGNLNDFLFGGQGCDRLTGGPGRDTFLIGDSYSGGRPDVITDFSPGSDFLAFSKRIVNAEIDDSIHLFSLADIKASRNLTSLFAMHKADHYMLIDTAANIAKSLSLFKDHVVDFALNMTTRSLHYGAAGFWHRDSQQLCRFSDDRPLQFLAADITFGYVAE